MIVIVIVSYLTDRYTDRCTQQDHLLSLVLRKLSLMSYKLCYLLVIYCIELAKNFIVLAHILTLLDLIEMVPILFMSYENC